MEDGAGSIIDSGLRGDEDPCGGLVSLAHASSNRVVSHCNLSTMLIIIIVHEMYFAFTFKMCCCHKRYCWRSVLAVQSCTVNLTIASQTIHLMALLNGYKKCDSTSPQQLRTTES